MPSEQTKAAGQVRTKGATLCTQCSARAVRPRARPGRTIRFRNLAALPIPADFPIMTCSRCGVESLNAQTRRKLTPLLQAEYCAVLRVRVRQAIDTLSQYISQRRLERHLGLSQGYLSRLRSGAGNPSPELVSNLAILAKDPKVRLQELERYWAEPTLLNAPNPRPLFPRQAGQP